MIEKSKPDKDRMKNIAALMNKKFSYNIEKLRKDNRLNPMEIRNITLPVCLGIIESIFASAEAAGLNQDQFNHLGSVFTDWADTFQKKIKESNIILPAAAPNFSSVVVM